LNWASWMWLWGTWKYCWEYCIIKCILCSFSSIKFNLRILKAENINWLSFILWHFRVKCLFKLLATVPLELTSACRLLDRVQSEDPAWKESGAAFISSVTRLLERLLDYRSVIQGDENRDKRMSCTVNLLVYIDVMPVRQLLLDVLSVESAAIIVLVSVITPYTHKLFCSPIISFTLHK